MELSRGWLDTDALLPQKEQKNMMSSSYFALLVARTNVTLQKTTALLFLFFLGGLSLPIILGLFKLRLQC